MLRETSRSFVHAYLYNTYGGRKPFARWKIFW